MPETTNDSVSDSTLVAWTPPRPAEIPALHANLRQWLSHPVLLQITCDFIDAGRGTIIPAAPTPLHSTVILHSEEAARLDAAHLYSIDEEMTAEAVAAGALLPDWSVQADDLPAEAGFLVFDAPIGHSEDVSVGTAPIVACSWGPSPHCAPPSGAVWLTFWAAPDYESLIQTGIDHGMSPAEARVNATRCSPPLLWDDEALLCWSAGVPKLTTTTRYIPSGDVTGVVAHGRTLSWIQTVLAAWMQIQDPGVVEITEQYAPRPERRRAQREGRTLPPVRVVSIHRRVSSTARPAEPTGRTVSVRFEVRGFWRDQPYGPGRSLRKRKWVKKHWRGPKDAPVLSRPTVTVVEPVPAPAE